MNTLRNTLGEYDDSNNNDGGDFDSLEFVPTIPRPDYEIGKPVELPDSFDARKEWPKCSSISHIRVQGKCKNCWVSYMCIAIKTNIFFFTLIYINIY